MPKKYKQKSLLTKPTSSAPSNLSLSRSSIDQNVPTQKTVNDLIRESRRGDTNERAQSTQTAATLPPSLRLMLNVPTPPPPAPRTGIRGPTRLRRIPGPPPPRSWLTDSIHAPPEARNIPWSKAHEPSRIQTQTSTLPEGAFPSNGSLQHLVMKRMASGWHWHAEYDHEYLAELPTKIKQSLLSYLAIYGEAQGTSPLRILFPSTLDQQERDEVRRLDLGNAIGGWTTLKRIEKELEGEKFDHEKQALLSGSEHDIPDAWDEDNPIDHPLTVGKLSMNSMRYNNLKHLSLAVSPGTERSLVSWQNLLSLTSKLSTITSLSLAYWPQPTYTPNASTGMTRIHNHASGSGPAITYGGTNFYTALDDDWREAAGILRTLSRSLYCLKWLDLTGCGEWFAALVWREPKAESLAASTGPDWNGSWRSLDHIVLAVGWTPGPSPSEQILQTRIDARRDDVATYAQSTGSEERLSDLLAQLSSARLGPNAALHDDHAETWNVEFEREKYYHRKEIERHSEIENRARYVASAIRSIRKESGGKWVDVDFGLGEEQTL